MNKVKSLLLTVAVVCSQNAWVFAVDGLDSMTGTTIETSVGRIIKYVANIAALLFGGFGMIQVGIAGIIEHDAAKAFQRLGTTVFGIVIIYSAWALAKFSLKFIG